MSYIVDDHRVQVLLTACQSIFSHPIKKFIVGSTFGVFSFFFGDLLWISLVGLGVLMMFDLITGLQASRVSNEHFVLSRLIASTGIKAGMYLIFISAGSVVEWSVPQIPSQLELINEGIVGVFIFSEFTSILENGASIGFKFPKKLLAYIKNTK